MKQRLFYLLRYIIFWLSLFVFFRILFQLYYFDLSREIGFINNLLSIFNGLRLDFSFTGYLLAIPLIIITLLFWLPFTVSQQIIKWYSYLFIVIIVSLYLSDLQLYKYWGFRLDSTPLLYLKTPKDAMASINSGMIVKFIIASLLVYPLSFYFYNKFVNVKWEFNRSKIWYIPVFIFLFFTLIIPIRGGVGIAPINPGTVYFSQFPYANHAALNVPWNVAYALTHLDSESDISFMEDEKAEYIVNDLYKNSPESFNALNSKDVNIIVIIWESLTAKVVAPLGGMENITPNLNKLAHEGILYRNFYASGDRSDKGIIAILSGYPSQPTQSIIKFANKTQSLPYLSKDLKNNGYSTSFYYGGDLDFANMRSYFLNGLYDNIIEMDDFDSKYNTSKWGVHDHVVFNKFYEDIKNEKGKFFKVLFTLSSHEPFDVPMDPVIQGNDDESKFLNSMVYTDKTLNNFIEKLKNTDKWDNTLVIVLADHGARHPGNTPNYQIPKFHVPMLWIGGALNVKDTIIEKYCSQTDLAATLLNELEMDASAYQFSKNIHSNSTKSFAFYCFNNGFGFLNEDGTTIFNNRKQDYILNKGKKVENINDIGKAYLQVVMKDFNSR